MVLRYHSGVDDQKVRDRHAGKAWVHMALVYMPSVFTAWRLRLAALPLAARFEREKYSEIPFNCLKETKNCE